MSKILIIGKTGQVGKELLQIFDPVKVVALNREQLDILKTTEIRDYIFKIKPNIIINTAAYHDLHRCEENPCLAFRVNWLAIKELSGIAKSVGAKLITFSTNYVFDGSQIEPYKEDDHPNPIQIYGMSKLAGEEAILKYYPDNSIIIRTSAVFGGHGSFEKGGNFILNRLQDADKKELEIDSQQVTSIAYAKDLALVIKQLVKNNIDSGIYHVVNEGKCSWFELTNYVFSLINSKCCLKPVERHGIDGKVSRPIYTSLNAEKIRGKGISLPFWQDAVNRYLRELNCI